MVRGLVVLRSLMLTSGNVVVILTVLARAVLGITSPGRRVALTSFRMLILVSLFVLLLRLRVLLRVRGRLRRLVLLRLRLLVLFLLARLCRLFLVRPLMVRL